MGQRKDSAAGVIPVHKKNNGEFIFCLIRDKNGFWGFPKGHQDVGEIEEATAIRELEEEAGIKDVDLDQQTFSETYVHDRNGEKIEKTVTYFLGFVPNMTNATPDEFKKEITEMRWLSYPEAVATIRPQTQPLLEEAWEYLQKSLE